MVVGSNPVAVTLVSDIAPVSSMRFFNIQTTIECRFTLKGVRNMIITCSQYPFCLRKKLEMNFLT